MSNIKSTSTPESGDENQNPERFESKDVTDDSEKLDSKVEGLYDASSIQVLQGLEAVRLRPGMYVGDNGRKGLHQMFREVLDNGVDEALAGHCDTIKVHMFDDGSVSHEDNGRGIPVDIHPEEGISALTVIMTKLHAGGKFGGGGYKVSGGLHGVGVSCTNALSEWMETRVMRDGKIYLQRFEKGFPVSEVTVVGTSTHTGTIQHWKPDPTVLTDTNHDFHILKRRMKEIAYLNSSLTLEFTSDPLPDENETFQFERGIVQLVEDMNQSEDAVHKPIYFHRVGKGMEIEIAIQYNLGFHTNVLAYSNNIYQPDGGTHVSGFSQALTRVINAYARKMNFLKEKDKNFTADDVAEGVCAVIALKLENPSYNSQTRSSS